MIEIFAIKNYFPFQFVSKRSLRLLREFTWVGLGYAIAAIGSLIGVRLLTSVLSSDVYGELALGLTAVTLVTQIIVGPLSNAALRFFSTACESGHFFSFISALRKLIIWSTGIILLVAAILCIGLSFTSYSHLLGLVAVAFIFSLVSGYNSVFNSIQNAARQRPIVAWHQALFSWGRFLMATGLAAWFGNNSIFALVGFSVASIIILFSQTIFFRRVINSFGKDSSLANGAEVANYIREMRRFAMPFVITGIFVFLQQASDRWSLQWFVSTKDVGYYTVLFQLGYYPMIFLSGLASQLFMPIYFNRIGDAKTATRIKQADQLNAKLLIMTLLATVLVAGLMWFIHPLVFTLFAAPEYQSVSYLLPLMILCSGITMSIQWAAMFLLGHFQTHCLILPNIVGNILGIAFHVFGAYFGALNGLVIGKLLFLIIYFSWLLVLAVAVSRRKIQTEYAEQTLQ